jgi:hypothetical protein
MLQQQTQNRKASRAIKAKSNNAKQIDNATYTT